MDEPEWRDGEVEMGTRWRHWKGGTYTLLGRGFIEATGEAAIVYQSEQTHVIWVRPLGNFLGKVKDAGAPSPSVDRFVRIRAAGDTYPGEEER